MSASIIVMFAALAALAGSFGAYVWWSARRMAALVAELVSAHKDELEARQRLVLAEARAERLGFELATATRALADDDERDSAVEEVTRERESSTSIGSGLRSDDAAGRVRRIIEKYRAEQAARGALPASSSTSVPSSPAAGAPGTAGHVPE